MGALWRERAGAEDEISDALSYHLREQGVPIRHEEQMEKVETRDDGVVLHLKSGKRLKADIFLWANGRTGNTQDLGRQPSSARRLESVGT